MRAHFDDADAQLREALWDAMEHEGVKRADHRELELGESGIIGEKIVGRKRAVGRMHADRQIQARSPAHTMDKNRDR